MSLKGFDCPRGFGRVGIEKCLNDCPAAPLRCMTPEMLVTVYREFQPRPGVYHVTESKDPPQKIWLQRNRDFYADPRSLVAMTLGTGLHLLMESAPKRFAEYGYLEDVEYETPFEVSVGPAKLVGRIDRYSKTTKTLTDYKTGKAYSALLLKGDRQGNGKDDYIWQINRYRVYGRPEAERMVLEFSIKDWTVAESLETGLQPIETILVPFISDDKVREETERVIGEFSAAEETGKFRRCTEEEQWWRPVKSKFGKVMKPRCPTRCLYYCQVSGVCPQHQTWVMEHS